MSNVARLPKAGSLVLEIRISLSFGDAFASIFCVYIHFVNNILSELAARA
jgi:hypothetical protein